MKELVQRLVEKLRSYTFSHVSDCRCSVCDLLQEAETALLKEGV